MEPVFGQRRQKGTKMECAIFVPELFIDSYCSRRKNCWNQRYRGCGREQYRYYFLLLTGSHPGNQHGFHPGNRFGSRTDRPGGYCWKKSRCRSYFRSYNHTRYWRSRTGVVIVIIGRGAAATGVVIVIIGRGTAATSTSAVAARMAGIAGVVAATAVIIASASAAVPIRSTKTVSKAIT